MAEVVSTNQFRNGMHIELEGQTWRIVEFQHVKPGKGGAFVRTKLKKVAGGAVLERTFRADEKVPLAVIDKREMQYLYREGDALVFMDNESYDQLPVPTDRLGAATRYLKEGDAAVLPIYDGEVLGVDLPAAVELTVVDTEPGVQGDRVSGARKAATLETGYVIQVPLFVETGEKLKVDTRTGDYLTRA
jgi:elongation factor P